MGLIICGEISSEPSLSQNLNKELSSTESHILSINPNDRFIDVVLQLQTLLEQGQWENKENEKPIELPVEFTHFSPYEMNLNLVFSHAGITARAKKSQSRSYENAPSSEEKDYITYIVKTLGFESILTINGQKSRLKQRGEKIKKVHPLRFLETIFLDEESKAGMIAIQDRTSFIKNNFCDGIIGSLKEENDRKNLLPYLSDFRKNLGISAKDFIPLENSLKENDYKGFVNGLIEILPRKNDPKRYNM